MWRPQSERLAHFELAFKRVAPELLIARYQTAGGPPYQRISEGVVLNSANEDPGELDHVGSIGSRAENANVTSMTRRSDCSQRCDVFGLCFLAPKLADRNQSAEEFLFVEVCWANHLTFRKWLDTLCVLIFWSFLIWHVLDPQYFQLSAFQWVQFTSYSRDDANPPAIFEAWSFDCFHRSLCGVAAANLCWTAESRCPGWYLGHGRPQWCCGGPHGRHGSNGLFHCAGAGLASVHGWKSRWRPWGNIHHEGWGQEEGLHRWWEVHQSRREVLRQVWRIRRCLRHPLCGCLHCSHGDLLLVRAWLRPLGELKIRWMHMHSSEQQYTVQLGFCNVHMNRLNEYVSAVVAGVKAVFAAQNASTFQRKNVQAGLCFGCRGSVDAALCTSQRWIGMRPVGHIALHIGMNWGFTPCARRVSVWQWQVTWQGLCPILFIQWVCPKMVPPNGSFGFLGTPFSDKLSSIFTKFDEVFVGFCWFLDILSWSLLAQWWFIFPYLSWRQFAQAQSFAFTGDHGNCAWHHHEGCHRSKAGISKKGVVFFFRNPVTMTGFHFKNDANN